MKYLHYLTIYLLLSGSLSLCAQTYPPEAVREDLRYLAAAMSKNIPCLLQYHPDFPSQAAELIEGVEDPLTALEHFRLVSRLATLGNEGHIGIIDTDSELYQGFTENRYHYLPLHVRVLNDRLFVADVFTDTEDLKPHNEIIALNGRPPAAVIDTLLKYIPADGFIETYQRLKLSDGFNWLYYLYIEQPEVFQLEVRDHSSGAVRKTLVPAVTLADMRNFYQNSGRKAPSSPSPDSEVYELKFFGDHALLKLKSFDWSSVKKEKLKSRRLYKNLFRQIARSGTENLIVDLRGNTGGRNEFADDILPFINQSGRRGVLKTSISWQGKTKAYRVPKADRRLFSGRIFVLVDGQTYSAGATLARYLREYGRATFIGEEAGTRYEGFAAGSQNLITLPRSQWEVRLPRYHIRFLQSKRQTTENRGLLPDIKIAQSYEDWVNGKDGAYLKAMELIAGQKR